MTAPRGRGRPQVFDGIARARYLQAVAAGVPLAQAAAAVGVVERTVRLAAQDDPEFAAARKAAQAAGRAYRHANQLGADGKPIPHGEYRYNHLECRCEICTAEAARGRAHRPDRQPRGAAVVALDPPSPKPKPHPFSLAKAS